MASRFIRRFCKKIVSFDVLLNFIRRFYIIHSTVVPLVSFIACSDLRRLWHKSSQIPKKKKKNPRIPKNVPNFPDCKKLSKFVAENLANSWKNCTQFQKNTCGYGLNRISVLSFLKTISYSAWVHFHFALNNNVLSYRSITCAMQEVVAGAFCVLKVPNLAKKPWFVTLPNGWNANNRVTFSTGM